MREPNAEEKKRAAEVPGIRRTLWPEEIAAFASALAAYGDEREKAASAHCRVCGDQLDDQDVCSPCHLDGVANETARGDERAAEARKAALEEALEWLRFRGEGAGAGAGRIQCEIRALADKQEPAPRVDTSAITDFHEHVERVMAEVEEPAPSKPYHCDTCDSHGWTDCPTCGDDAKPQCDGCARGLPREKPIRPGPAIHWSNDPNDGPYAFICTATKEPGR